MRVLVLGGSWFLGRAVVDEAYGAGHDVTVFNRGRTAPPPSGVDFVRGDRTSAVDLARLTESGAWDVVVDVPGVIPAQVRDAARALSGVVERYMFVSTVSAYRDWPAQSVVEDSPLHQGDPDANPTDWTWGTGPYGSLKAGAEAAVLREYPDGRATIVRPGVILGPGEYGGRLTWWLQRAVRGGQILAPGTPTDPIRPVDVRDVAAFLLHLAATDLGGVFNVAGPTGRDTYGSLISGCLNVTGGAGTPVWVAADWLAAEDVRQWTEVPMWRTAAGTWAIDTTRAEGAGLVCRPLLDTIRDTWVWLRSGGRPVDDPRRKLHGLNPDREARLLAAWAATGRTEAPEADVR